MQNFNFKIIIKFILFFYLIIIDKNICLPKLNQHPFYLPNKKPILSFDENKEKALKHGRNYLDKCLQVLNYHRFIL